MKTTKARLCVGLIFVVAFTIIFGGCADKNQSGSTVLEPEITVEYLEGDYVKQLLRDGAVHVFGSIELSQNEDDSIVVNVEEKEYVEDSTLANGFYVEDKNTSLTTTLASEARCTFISKGVSLPQIMNTQQFVESFNKEMEEYGGTNNPDYKNEKLYDMYIMGDQIELILEKYIP